MSLDLLTIGLGFQTDGLEKGTAALKNNEQAANKAADAADNASSKMRIMSDAQKAAASATEKVRESIDKQVSAMRQQVETFGMSERQSKLYKLSIDGATESQLKQAEAALKQVDALKRAGEMGESAGRAIKVGALAAAAGIGATIAAFELLIGKVSQYQDLAEQTGGDPAGIASLRTAADVGGASIEQLIASANRMQRSLASVDDESKGVGRALGAIGIEVESFKKLRADEQIKAVAKAMSGYEDGLGKVAVMNDIFGRGSAALIPAMKELAAQTDTNNGLTTEQIKLADDYKDAQARAKSELMQFAEQMAVAALPMVTAFTGAVQDTLKELFSLDSQGNKLAKSNDVADFAEVSATSLASLVDIGYGVAQVFNLIGNNIGAALAQATEFAKGNFEGAAEIGRASNEFNSKLSFSLGLSEKLEARIKSIKSAAKDNPQDGGNEKQLEYHIKAAKAVKAVADEYAKLSAEIAKQLALSQAELDGGGKLEASEKYRITTLEKLIEQYQAGKITLKEYIDLESKMNDVQGVMEKAEAQAKAAKAAQAAYAESLQFQDDLNKALRDEEDARNKIRMAVGANTVAAEEAQALAELEMQTVFASAEDRKRILDYYRIELDLRKKIAAINSAGGIDQAERDRLIAIEAENAARLKGVADMGAAMQSTTSIWQSIDQTAHSVWTNVLQGGQDIWSKLRNTAKSVFFDWLYQMTLKKWIFSIGATMTGTGAIAQGAGGSGSGGMSTISNLSSLAGAGMQYFGGASVGASSASLFAANATGAVGGDALGAMIAGNGGWAGVSATGGAAAGTAATGAGMMSTIGAAMPYIAAAAGVYMFAKSREGGETRSGATYTAAADGSAQFNQGPSGGEIAADQSRGLFSSTQTEINRLLAGFGSKATVTGFTAGLESSKNGKGFQFSGGYIGDKAFGENLGRTGGQFSMQSQDQGQALANFATDLQRSVLQALSAADLGGKVGAWINGLGDIEALSQTQVTSLLAQVTAYQQWDAAAKSLPDSLAYLKNMTVEASAKFVESAGGIAGATQLLGTYFDLFATDAEKQQQQTKNLSDAFSSVGVTMPALSEGTRDWYKSIVASLGAQDLSVESNAKAYAGVLSLASAVDSLAPAAEASAEAIAVVAATWAQNWQQSMRDAVKSSTGGISSILRDGMLGKISKDDLGGQVADAIGDGITNAMASTLADQIANTFATSIITPIIDAIAQGAAISSAVSQASIDSAIAAAKTSMQAVSTLMSDPDFQALMAGIKTGFGGGSSGGAYKPTYGNADGTAWGGSTTTGRAADDTSGWDQAAKDAFYRAKHQTLLGLDKDNQAYAAANGMGTPKAIAFHLSAYDAAMQAQALQDEIDKLGTAIVDESKRRADERFIVDDVNLALYDRVQSLKDEAAATDLLKQSTDAQKSWQDKLDALNNKSNSEALQQAKDIADVTAHETAAQAQLAYVTDAAARAALQQSIATDEATKAIINQVYAQTQAAAIAAERAGWQDKLDVLSGKTTDRALQMQRDLSSTTDAATKALILQVYAMQDQATAAAAATKALADQKSAASRGTDTAMSAVQRAVDAQRKLVQTQLQVANESVSTLTSIFNTLKSNVNDLYGQVDSTASASATAGQAFIANALANAKSTGYMPDAAALTDAIGAARKGIDATQYATQAEADYARVVLAGQLDQLKGMSGKQLTAAQQAAKDAQDQITALDNVLEQAQAQVDALRGVDNSVLSVKDAIDKLSAAILGEKSANAAAGGTGASDPLAAASLGGFADLGAAQKALLANAVGDFASTNFKSAGDAEKAALAAGSASTSIFVTTASALAALNATADSALTAAGNVSKYLTLASASTLSMTDRTAYNSGAITADDLLHKYGIPGYAVGTPWVPEDGLAYLHKGEAVIPAQYNSPSIGGQGGNTARLESLVQALTVEVQRLQGVVANGNDNTKKLADQFDAVSAGGNALLTETAQ